MRYSAAFANVHSKEFVETARKIEKEMFTEINKNIAQVISIRVISYMDGNGTALIAKFNIIINPTATKNPAWNNMFSALIKAAATYNAFTFIADSTFDPQVKGRFESACLSFLWYTLC